MMKMLTLYAALVLLPLWLNAQGEPMSVSAFQQELAGVQKQFSAANTQITYSRDLVIDGEEPSHEEGTFLRGSGLDYRLEQNGVLIIQNKSGKLVIDTLQSTIILTIVDSLFSMMNTPNLTDANVSKVYALSKSVTKTEKTYRMTPRVDGLESAELVVPVNGFTPVVMRVTLPPGNYISHSIDDMSIEEPVMTIVYSGIKNVRPAAPQFSFDKYLTYTDGKYSLKNTVSGFTFHDLRPNTTK